ncbi:MAG: hypothetical protein WCY77_11700 [Weeksellaceae bacterium]
MHKLLGFFFVYNLFFGFCYSQNQGVKREKGFQFNLQTFAMVVGNADEIDTTPTEYFMHVRDSRLFGVNLEASYRFDEYWIVGLGSGFEQINQPDISYIPVYLSLRSSIGGDKIEAPIFRLDVGTHFGDLAKNGALLRAGIGYRLPIYKELCLNLEGIITYQGIRKEFESHPDVIQYYNMYGFGIGVGLEL